VIGPGKKPPGTDTERIPAPEIHNHIVGVIIGHSPKKSTFSFPAADRRETFASLNPVLKWRCIHRLSTFLSISGFKPCLNATIRDPDYFCP
jgi:hypothetical protein